YLIATPVTPRRAGGIPVPGARPIGGSGERIWPAKTPQAENGGLALLERGIAAVLNPPSGARAPCPRLGIGTCQADPRPRGERKKDFFPGWLPKQSKARRGHI